MSKIEIIVKLMLVIKLRCSLSQNYIFRLFKNYIFSLVFTARVTFGHKLHTQVVAGDAFETRVSTRCK